MSLGAGTHENLFTNLKIIKENGLLDSKWPILKLRDRQYHALCVSTLRPFEVKFKEINNHLFG